MSDSARPSGEKCEYWPNVPDGPKCGVRAWMRYPAMGGGFMYLCWTHGEKHADYCEVWDGSTWTPSPAEQRKEPT